MDQNKNGLRMILMSPIPDPNHMKLVRKPDRKTLMQAEDTKDA